MAVGSLAMQVAAVLNERISPRQLLVTGGVIYASCVYLAQYTATFGHFFLVYAVMAGIGYGLLYFLPLQCAWSYFPHSRSLLSGVILCCFSLNAIVTSEVSTNIVNSEDAEPTVVVKTG